jgi:hypothetical protein
MADILNVSGIGYLVVALCAAFFAIRLHISYERNKNVLSLYYSRAFFFFTFMSVSYGLPTFLWAGSQERLVLGELVGNIFLVLGLAYLVMVPLYISKGAAAARWGFTTVATVGVILLLLTIQYVPYLYFDENSILTKSYHPVLKTGYYLFIAGITGFVSFTFFREATNRSGYSRTRSILLALGFLFGGVGGGFIKVVESTTLLAYSLASLIIGFLFIFASALYKKDQDEE